MKTQIILCILSLFIDTASAKENRLFREHLEKNANSIWAENLPRPLIEAKNAFQMKKKFGTHRYGQSNLRIDIRNRELTSLEKELTQKGYRKFNCPYWQIVDGRFVFTKSGKKKIKTRPDGKPILLWTYLHPDGSRIRIKPEGDPLAKYRKRPDITKTLQYPPHANPCDYRAEHLGVTHNGKIVGNHPRYMKSPYRPGTPKNAAYWSDWADQIHAYLKNPVVQSSQ